MEKYIERLHQEEFLRKIDGVSESNKRYINKSAPQVKTVLTTYRCIQKNAIPTCQCHPQVWKLKADVRELKRKMQSLEDIVAGQELQIRDLLARLGMHHRDVGPTHED
jgi:hypothetical protein